MKKILSVLLGLSMVLVLSGCGDKDTEAPVITLKSNAITEFTEHSDIPNWSSYIEVVDNVDVDFVVVIDDANVEMDSLGTFDVIYSVEDEAGNKSEPYILTITIIDGKAPTIVLSEGAVLFYAEDSVEPDWNVLVDLNDDHDTTLTVSVDDSLVDMNNIGTFVVSYNTTDSVGNEANSLDVTITIYDKDSPVITMSTSAILLYGVLTTEPDWSFLVEVEDNYDNDLQVEVNVSNVEMDIVGTFDIEYTVSDLEGNQAEPFILMITIIDDENPTVSLAIDAQVEYDEGSDEPNWEELVLVEDNYDDNVELSVDTTNMDMNVIGMFDVTLTATDDQGNIDTLIVTIEILDATAPVITLNETMEHIRYKDFITLGLNNVETVWSDFVVVVDNYDTETIVSVDASLVDMTVEGTYNVIFTATDEAGNVSESFEILVNVKALEAFNFEFESWYANTGGYGFGVAQDPIINGNNVITRAGSLGGRLAFQSTIGNVDPIGKDFTVDYDFALKEVHEDPVFGINLSSRPFVNADKIFFRYSTATQTFEFTQSLDGQKMLSEKIYFEIEELTYYHFRLEVYGSRFVVYIDDQLIYDGGILPATFTEEIYITMNHPVIIDNVKIVLFDKDPLVNNVPIVVSENELKSSTYYLNEIEPDWTTFVKMYDDYNLPFTMTIDSSLVDMTTIGDYEVAYQLTDDFGNVTDFVLPVSISDLPTIEVKLDAILTYEDNVEIIWEDLVNITNPSDLIVVALANGNDLSVPGEYLVTITLRTPFGRTIVSVDETITITASDEYLVNEAKDDLDLGDLSAIESDIVLPFIGLNSSTIVWESDSQDISTIGVVTRPAYLDGDVTVTLTATISLNAESTTQEFVVTIKRMDPTNLDLVNEAKTNLDLGDISAIIDDLVLPLLDPNGAIISWESSNIAITSEGIVTRDASVDLTVTLTATIISNDVTDTKEFVVTVLKETIE